MSFDLNQTYQNIQNTLGNQSYNGMCEAWAEQVTGSGNQGASAIDAWNRASDGAVQGTQGMQPGDKVYFDADNSNGGYGHVGVYMGDNRFASATYSGVRAYDLNDWVKQSGQKVLGYIPSAFHGSINLYDGPKMESPDSHADGYQWQPSWLPGTDGGWANGGLASGVQQNQKQVAAYTAAPDLLTQLDALRQNTAAQINNQFKSARDTNPSLENSVEDQVHTFLGTMAKSTSWSDPSNIGSMNINTDNGSAMSGYAASSVMPYADNPWAQKAAQIGNQVFSQALGPDLAQKLTPMFVKQIHQESGFDPDVIYGRRSSSAGAQGIAQIMPKMHPDVNPLDPDAALNYAATLMSNSFTNYGGNVAKSLAAYNAGAGTLNAAVEKGGQDWLSYMPKETQGYIQSIIGTTGN